MQLESISPSGEWTKSNLGKGKFSALLSQTKKKRSHLHSLYVQYKTSSQTRIQWQEM